MKKPQGAPLACRSLANRAGRPIEWRVSEGQTGYPDAVAEMDERVAAIHSGGERELVWLVEHPPLYTAGTSAKPADLLDPHRFPVFRSGRGGQYTYHGPGQRIAYVMLDLNARTRDVRCFVSYLETWIIETLAAFGVGGERMADRVGVWVRKDDGSEAKIAAVGVRVRHGVTFHGISINVAPDLDHYSGIIPCGVNDRGVTSLADLDIDASMSDVDAALMSAFTRTFGDEITRHPAESESHPPPHHRRPLWHRPR